MSNWSYIVTKPSNCRGWDIHFTERKCSGISGFITNGAGEDHRGQILLLIFSLTFNTSDSLQSSFFATALSPSSLLIFHVSGPSSQLRCLHLLSPHPLAAASLPLPWHTWIAKSYHCFPVRTSKLPTTIFLLSSCRSLFAMFPWVSQP